MKKTRIISLLLLSVLLSLLLLSCSPLREEERTLLERGCKVTVVEEGLHTDLAYRLDASRDGKSLQVLVFHDEEKAEAMYMALVAGYQSVPNKIAAIDGCKVYDGHVEIFNLLEK